MNKQLVIIGAGYAGILTAKKVAKRIKKLRLDVDVTIIDRNPFHTMLTELHEVAAGRVDEDSIRISLERVFAGRRVNVVRDTVSSVDFEGRRVIGEQGVYDYDYVVIAAGSRPTYFGVEGAAEHAFKLWSYDDAVRLRAHILDCFRRAMRENDEAERRRLLTFHIVGAGFTGVEMAGELAEWVPVLCEKFEIPREDVTIIDMDVLSRSVPQLSERSSKKIERRLAKMGVEMQLNSNVSAIGPDFIEVKGKDGELRRQASGTVIWAAGIQASEITAQAGETLENAGRGRIRTDSHMRALSDPHVYVVGDNIFYVPEGEKAPIPQMVEMAEHSADTVAHNLIVDLGGGERSQKYQEYDELDTRTHGVMVSVGGRWAAAEVGSDKRKFRLASFFAMFVKHLINMIYFAQVLGWNKVFSYLKHEFFTVRNRRSFVGGHFSNRTPSWVLVPLRLWLGAVWFFEGVMKVIEGWFGESKLAGFLKGANDFYAGFLSKAGGAADATSAATDAVSSASDAVGEAAGTLIFNLDLWLIKPLLVSAKPLAESTLADYAFRVEVPLLNWFLNQVVLPSNGLTMFMQIAIVVAEMGVGLALFSGTFTTLAALAAIALQLMFLTTTGWYLSNVWMLFASFAMCFGAGRIFGLDYYLQPPLKRWWKRVGWVRKSYLYHD